MVKLLPNLEIEIIHLLHKLYVEHNYMHQSALNMNLFKRHDIRRRDVTLIMISDESLNSVTYLINNLTRDTIYELPNKCMKRGTPTPEDTSIDLHSSKTSHHWPHE